MTSTTEVKASFDPDLVVEPDIKWLEHVISREIAGGRRLLPDQTLQLGWLFMKFREEPDGALILLEPNFSGIPMQFLPSVTRSLMHLRLQKSVAESVGLSQEASFPSPLQSALTCTKLDDVGEFMMERFAPSGNDSGWYLGCTDEKHDHNVPQTLRRKSLYEIACYRPECIPFLALPEDSKIAIAEDQIKLHFAGKDLSPQPASFLDRYLLQARERARSNSERKNRR